MTVTSIRDAWAEVQKIFPTRYEHDANRSERAGYPIYYSTASDVNAWISDLGNRLEVNLPDGKSVNMEFYEDPACRPSDWQSRWRGTAAIWEDALRLFRERDFSAAMRLFAKVLRRMPEDQAVRWYLFRCDALCGSQARPSDTELLFDWGKGGHE